MTEELTTARRGLHAIAERVLAGPQYQHSGRIRLRVTAEGFATTEAVAEGIASLTVSRGAITKEPGGIVVPLIGTVAEIAANVGVEAGPPPDSLYPPSADLHADTHLDLNDGATEQVLAVLRDGHRSLARVFPGADPVLWPEHFDVTVVEGEVNYGVSTGDDEIPLPYGYVSPWTPRPGAFWNASFGASAPVDGDLDTFFRRGRELAAGAAD